MENYLKGLLDRMDASDAVAPIGTQALYFDDVDVGERWTSPRRVVAQEDVETFAYLTGDENPLHLDRDFASTTPFGQPIAHGLYGLSLVAGLGSRHPLMQPAVFVRILEWQFLQPIYLGDAVHVETEVLSKHSAGRRRGLILWKRRLVNQDASIVQEGKVETLVVLHPERARQPR